MYKLWFALVLMALLPAAMAQDDSLTARSVHAEGAQVVGDLTVLKLLAEPDSKPDATFVLEAANLRLELDHTDLFLDSGIQQTFIEPTTTPNTHSAARVTGIDNHGEALFALDRWPGHGAPVVTVMGTCMELEGPDRAVEVTSPVVKQSRPDRETDLTRSIRPASCDAAFAATVEGDLRLSLWDWDFLLTDQEDSRTVQTGIHDHDGTQRAQEAFLYAQNATLHITFHDPAAFHVHAPRASADALTLKDAHGPLGTQVLAGEDLAFGPVKDLTLQASGVDTPLQVHVPDGAAPATLAPHNPGNNPAWALNPYWTTGLLLAIAAVAWSIAQRPLLHESLVRRYAGDQGSVAATSRGERRAVGYWHMARNAHHRGHHRLALHYARQAHRRFDMLPEIRWMLATALSRRGHHLESLRAYLDAAAALPSPAQRGRAWYGAATCYAHIDDREGALDALERAARLAATYVQQRLGRNIFNAVRNDVRFRTIVRQANHWSQSSGCFQPSNGADVS